MSCSRSSVPLAVVLMLASGCEPTEHASDQGETETTSSRATDESGDGDGDDHNVC